MLHCFKQSQKYIIIFMIFFSNSSIASDLKLIGRGLLEYSIFKIDIYEVLYYKGMNGHEELVLDYKRDVEKKHSVEGWTVGFEPILKKHPEYQPKANWILKQTSDLLEGQRMTLRKVKNQVTMLKDDKIIATINDPIVSKLLFEP